MAGPLDNMDMATGDEFLQGETKVQIAKLYTNSVIEVILKHFGVPKAQAYNWCRQRFGATDLKEDCLVELVPDLKHRFVVHNVKFALKRVSTLEFDQLNKSTIGEAVRMFSADTEGTWLITNLPFLPGPIVVGLREFPLVRPFSGLVVADKESSECFLFLPLRQFLTSSYLKTLS